MDDETAAAIRRTQLRAVTRPDREMGIQFAIQSLAGVPHSPDELFGLAEQIGAYLRGEWVHPVQRHKAESYATTPGISPEAIREVLERTGGGRALRYDDIARAVVLPPEATLLMLEAMRESGEVATDDGISYRILMTADDQVAQG